MEESRVTMKGTCNGRSSVFIALDISAPSEADTGVGASGRLEEAAQRRGVLKVAAHPATLQVAPEAEPVDTLSWRRGRATGEAHALEEAAAGDPPPPF